MPRPISSRRSFKSWLRLWVGLLPRLPILLTAVRVAPIRPRAQIGAPKPQPHAAPQLAHKPAAKAAEGGAHLPTKKGPHVAKPEDVIPLEDEDFKEF